MKRFAVAVAVCALVGLGGCAVPLGGGGNGPAPSASAVEACNTRADEIFARQNRGADYQADTFQTSERDSPFSGAGTPGTERGLSDQYARGQDVRKCLNGVATPLSPSQSNTAEP
jgi:hypothetical protein